MVEVVDGGLGIRAIGDGISSGCRTVCKYQDGLHYIEMDLVNMVGAGGYFVGVCSSAMVCACRFASPGTAYSRMKFCVHLCVSCVYRGRGYTG